MGPHRQQLTRLHRPLDSPGRNTGVVCHFLLQCMQVKSESEVTQSCLTLCDPMTAAYQAPPTMGFSRQEYWSGLPLPSPPSDTSSKESACQCKRCTRHRFNPWIGTPPGGGHGNPLQYSCLENPMSEEPGGLRSIGSQRVGHDWSDLACVHAQVTNMCTDYPSLEIYLDPLLF